MPIEADEETEQQVAQFIYDTLPVEVFSTIRGIPPNRRKACVYIYGQPGTGKSLIAKILTCDLQTARVSTRDDTFKFGSVIQSTQAIIWDEALITQETSDITKQVFGGEELLIDLKAKPSQTLTGWRPIICTSNYPYWQLIDAVTEEAIGQRLYYIVLEEKIPVLQGKQLRLPAVLEKLHKLYKPECPWLQGVL